MLEIISPTAWRVYWDRLWSPTTSYPVDYKRIATDLYALESVCEQSELFGYEYKNTKPNITVVLIQYALIIEDMTWPRAWMWILSSSAKKFVFVVSYKSYWLQKYWLHITWKIVFKEAECRYHLRKWHLFSIQDLLLLISTIMSTDIVERKRKDLREICSSISWSRP